MDDSGENVSRWKELSILSVVLKMKTPHLVPLSRQALAILEKIKSMSGNRELIFVGDHDPRKPMSENTLNKALRVMGYDTKTEV